MRKPNPCSNYFIIHLKTSETYKTIRRGLPFCLFNFRVLLGSSCWPRQGLGTTESNIFFAIDAGSIQKTYYWTLSTSAADFVIKYRILRINRWFFTNQPIIITIIHQIFTIIQLFM